MSAPYFTVFTPTYNRAHTLGGIYESLKSQTFRNFEWLIVDDGSTDNTRDLVMRWQLEATYPIRYIYQENKGKHVASNVGAKDARGELFLFIDSDDTCLPETLEQFKMLWESIPEDMRPGYSAVSALCIDTKGQVVGGKYPADVIDAENGWEQLMLRSTGERFGICRTDILRSFPFPEFENEKFIPEGAVWNRMSRHYRTRFANRTLRIYEQRTDSLSTSSIRIRARSPIGSSLYYNELSFLKLPLLEKLKASVNYTRFCFHGKMPVSMILEKAISPLSVLLSIGLGYFMYRLDRYRI